MNKVVDGSEHHLNIVQSQIPSCALFPIPKHEHRFILMISLHTANVVQGSKHNEYFVPTVLPLYLVELLLQGTTSHSASCRDKHLLSAFKQRQLQHVQEEKHAGHY